MEFIQFQHKIQHRHFNNNCISLLSRMADKFQSIFNKSDRVNLLIYSRKMVQKYREKYTKAEIWLKCRY